MSKLTDLKAEQLTAIEGLGLSTEHLEAVKGSINTLTEAHNTSELNAKHVLNSAINTEKQTIANMQTTIDGLKKATPEPGATPEPTNVLDSDEYKLLLNERDELLATTNQQTELTEKASKKEAVVNALKASNMVYDDYTVNGLMQITEKTQDGKYIVKNEDETINLIDSHVADYAKDNPNRVILNGGSSGSGAGGDAANVLEKKDNSIASSVARAWGKN